MESVSLLAIIDVFATAMVVLFIGLLAWLLIGMDD